MRGFCIPKNLAENLKAAAKQGDIDIKQLYEMTSQERSETFARYTTPLVAEKINAGFEEAIISSQKNALKNWAERTFTGKEKSAPMYKDVVNKINELDKLGVIHPANAQSFMEDLVATKLGVRVTEAEVAEIAKRAKVIEDAAANVESGNKFDLPSLEYFKARREMQNYLDSLAPVSNLKVLTSTIGRGSMLFSLKSPITNVVGNSVMGLFQAVEKRIANGQLGGLNGDLAADYTKYAHQVYQKSGFDITRMTSIEGTFNTLGEGMTTAQGEGIIKKVGRVYEDVIFKQMMGAPDIVFSAAQFADTANLASSQVAYDEGLKGDAAKARAREIFTDAARIEPQTEAGKLVRAQGIMDAQYATFTNDSTYSKVSLGIRQLINNATGDLRLGDLIMPFVKTPANVVGATLDAAGLSGIRAIYDAPEAIRQLKAGNKAPMRQVMRNAVRSGLGLTVAFAIASAFGPDDFMGAYPTSAKERELMELKNATPNSIKMGDTWVSMDYFGPFAAAMQGLMYAKKYGDTSQDQLLKYVQAATQTGLRLPGIDTVAQTVSDMQSFAPADDTTAEENILGFVNSVSDQLSSRLIPSIISDLAKVLDTSERQVDYKDPIAKLKAKIPGLRNQLPEREDIFGEKIKTEPPWSVLLFGARRKTVRDNAVISELDRLDKAGQLPSITDVEKTSNRVKSFRAQVSAEKYTKAIDKYQQDFKNGIEKLIGQTNYKKAADDEKKSMIEKLKSDILDRTLITNGYRKGR